MNGASKSSGRKKGKVTVCRCVSVGRKDVMEREIKK